LQLNACEQAGCQRVVRVGKHDASSNRTGRWIELVVNEVDVTRVREVLLISQSNTDWILRAVIVAVLGAIAGALYPAFKAAGKDPIEALAYE